MALKYAQCPTWRRFRIFQISLKVRVLKLSQTTLMFCVSHMTYCQYSLLKCMWEMKRAKRLSLALVHSWNECKRWNAPNVYHWLWSTLWSHGQVCWLTTEYLVYQCAPNTSIVGQSESIRPTILTRISILFKTRSGYFVQLLSCFVRHFTIAFHAFFWHDLPCRRTTWKSPMFPRLVVFPMLLRKNLDSNMVL